MDLRRAVPTTTTTKTRTNERKSRQFATRIRRAAHRRDVARALEDVMRDDDDDEDEDDDEDDEDDGARVAEAVEVVLNLSLDASTSSWRENADAMARCDDAEKMWRVDGGDVDDVSVRLSRMEALLMMDDDAYLAEIAAPASTTKTHIHDDDDDDDDDMLIARALCELNSIKRVFYRWAMMAEDARNGRIREREARAICEFHFGRRMRRILVRSLRAWAAWAKRDAALRRFARKRAMRARREGFRAWRLAADASTTRRARAVARIKSSRTTRVKHTAFEMWKRTVRELIVNAHAREWRRVAIKITTMEAWRRGVETIRAEREAMQKADIFHTLRVQMRAFGVWQMKIVRAHAMVKKAFLRSTMIRWRQRVRVSKFDAQRNVLATQYDEARVMHVIFALWRANARERRIDARSMRRARAFRRAALKTNTFYAWVVQMRKAKSSRARLLFRAFSVWFTRVKRARRLEDIALYYVDSQAICFRDKYALPFFFSKWRDFVLTQRRRYAAMEFAEQSRVSRAFRTWRLGPTITPHTATHIVEEEQFIENIARAANAART